MSVVTQRKPALQAPSSIKAQSFTEQYNDGTTWQSILWYPTQGEKLTWRTQIKSYIMEFLATLVFTFLTVFSVVTAIDSGADTAIRSILIGLVGCGSYYMVTGWLRMPESELPRHASWLVTVSQMAVFRFGVFHGLFYLTMQLVGAIAAAGILFGFGPGFALTASDENWIPQQVDNVSRAWFAEIIGSFAIVFSLLYNHMAGVPNKDEHEHRREGEVMASVMRGLATIVFYRVGNWSFEPVVYLAGLFATGFHNGFLSATSATHLSAAFFILVPMLGMLLAIILYLILGPGLSNPVGHGRLAKRDVRLEKPIQHTQYVKVSE